MVDNVIGNLIKGLFNFVLIWREEYDSLSKYLQAYEHWYEVLLGAGFHLSNEVLRDLYMSELLSHNLSKGRVYKSLLDWKNIPTNGSANVDIEEGIQTLTEVIKVQMYIKRSGKDYEQFWQELSNQYN